MLFSFFFRTLSYGCRAMSVLKRAAIVAALYSLATACTETVRPESQPLTPVVGQAPLHVAIVYDEALVRHRCVASRGYLADEWVIEIGSPSTAMFNAAFSAMFEKVLFIPEAKVSSITSEWYIVRVSLENYTGCDASWPIVGSTVEVGYVAEVIHQSEKVLTGWTGRARVSAEDYQSSPPNPSSRSFDVEGNYLARTTEIAIRRALADFVANFEEDPRIIAWKVAAIAEARDD
jgi:hypothetical protein